MFDRKDWMFECLIEKIDGCKNNPENSSTIKVGENIASGFGMSMISSFKGIENKHNIHRVKDSMKKVLWTFKRMRNEDNLFQKEKMKLLTNE